MITSILEFRFSDHYNKEPDNRMALRFLNAVPISVTGQNVDDRFLRAVGSVLLGQLDKIQLASNVKNALILIPVYYKLNNKIQALEFSADDRIGSMYSVIIAEDTVVTILINRVTDTNEQIKLAAEKHSGTKLNNLYNWDFTIIESESNKKKPLVIDLDQTDDQFYTTWPAIRLQNNQYNTKLTQRQLDILTKTIEKQQFTQIGQESIQSVRDLIKEWTFAEGDQLLVPYPDGPKLKTVRKIIQNTKGDKTQWSLEFEKTLKPFDLVAGNQFIISPKIKNDKWYAMLKVFGAKDSDQLSFQGPIKSVSVYKKERFTDGKMRLGIIIEPRQVKIN